MIGILTIAGIIGTIAICKRKQAVSGIGATYKRRMYYEINRLQPVVDFTLNYYDQTEVAKKAIEDLYNTYYKEIYPNRKPITHERYYKQLKRAYNAISGIGETALPYFESKVRNEYGDVILIHRDYGTPEQKLSQAFTHVEENYRLRSDYDTGWWDTVYAIAQGKKFVWTSTKDQRGIEKLVFGKTAPEERKQRISYLASPSKGGIYPERLIHEIWESTDRTADDTEIADGVLAAFREVQSVKQAKEIFMKQYLKDHMIEDEEHMIDPDLPF